jgi:hypothetical protein
LLDALHLAGSLSYSIPNILYHGSRFDVRAWNYFIFIFILRFLPGVIHDDDISRPAVGCPALFAALPFDLLTSEGTVVILHLMCAKSHISWATIIARRLVHV